MTFLTPIVQALQACDLRIFFTRCVDPVRSVGALQAPQKLEFKLPHPPQSPEGDFFLFPQMCFDFES